MLTDFRCAVVLVGLVSVHLPSVAQAQPGEWPVPLVVASASAERGVRADLATVTLRFSRTGPTLAEAGHSVALKAEGLRSELGALGIPRDSMVTGSAWHWWRTRVEVERVERGFDRTTNTQVVDTLYRVHEAIEVRIRDLSKVGDVIDVALAQGITDLSRVEFYATDTEQAKLQAVADAARKARARAEAIATASGSRVGKTYSLSTEANADRNWFEDIQVGTTALEGRRENVETVVVQPVLRVTATVYGRWELVEEPDRQTEVP